MKASLSSQQSPLLQRLLLAELRNTIYRYVLVSWDSGTHIELKGLAKPALAGIWWQIKAEAPPIFFAENNFTLNVYCGYLYESLPRRIMRWCPARYYIGASTEDGNGKAFVAGVDESTTDADMADVVEHMANVVKAEIHERDVGGLDVDDLVVIASEHLLNSIPRRWKLEAGGWLDI